MNILFSDTFKESLRKHSSIKKAIKNKVDMIIENPIALGEPLKGDLRGYYSYPVQRNFIIIYLYCDICRRKSDDKIVLCIDCSKYLDDTIKFVIFGPHDDSYRKRTK